MENMQDLVTQNSRLVVNTDLAQDADEISSVEAQLIRLVALTVPQTLVVVRVV